MRRQVAVGALVAVAMLCATAAAEPRGSARARAAARFKQGQEFFKAHDYEHAIVEYEAAYQLSSEPALIFNIALCHDRAERPAQALAAFQRYLELAPSGEVADEARADVARLTPIVEAILARRAAEAAERAQQAHRVEAERAAAAAAAAEASRERARSEAAHHAMAQRSAELAHRAQIERWSGLALGAAGAVALGVGIKFGLDARAAASAITDHRGPWTDSALAREAAGRSAQTRMLVFTSLGSAAAIGGSVLYVIGRGHDTAARRVRLELQPTSSGGVVTLSGRF
jgi:tetratricopeptide (TPR) repeat protein